jgi:hypothetical protein
MNRLVPSKDNPLQDLLRYLLDWNKWVEALNEADICIGRLSFACSASHTDIVIREMYDVVRAITPPEQRRCVVCYHVVS